jgi:ADP-ribosylglycohydrolase
VGSVAVAGSVAYALVNKPVDRTDFVAEISQLAGIIDPSAEVVYSSLTDWMELEPIDAIRSIINAGYAFGDWQDWQGLTPFVTGTVLWALYSFLHSPESYLKTISTAIEIGGDVDTTAAIAGAISGAYLGIGSLPRDLAIYLTDRGTWGYGELTQLATDLYDLKNMQKELRHYA